MKVEGDKDLPFQEVTCQENNTFAEPAWNKCVESKHMCLIQFLWSIQFLYVLAVYCPPLPEPIVETWDVFAVLEHGGTFYRKCLTETSAQTCPLVNVTQTNIQRDTVQNFEMHTYEIMLPSNRSTVTLLFSANILTITVSWRKLNNFLRIIFFLIYISNLI